jgi:broad specificity phosphatase PhoE
MSHLLLVRHGQASAQSHDYDVLSQLGIRQARLLGAHLARAGQPIDALFTGPRKRQQDSAMHLYESAREAGVRYPGPIVLDEFDEMPFREILVAALHVFVDEPPLGTSRSFDQMRALVKRAVMAWASDEVTADGIEPFAAFTERVQRILARVASAGEHVLVTTSAGPIAVALQLAGAPGTESPRAAMDLAIDLVNASVSTLASDGAGGFDVVSMNNHAHLPHPLITLV